MKAVKIRIAYATIAGERGLVITSRDGNDTKICMTCIGINDDETGDVLVYEDGTLVSEDESNYDDCIESLQD